VTVVTIMPAVNSGALFPVLAVMRMFHTRLDPQSASPPRTGDCTPVRVYLRSIPLITLLEIVKSPLVAS
jgi:hypothetical protein